MTPADEEIKKRILDQIFCDSRIDPSGIDVSVNNGLVTLSGSTGTILSVQAARNIALTVPGVRSIKNQIAVTHPPNLTPPDDTEIRSNIETILDWNPELEGGDIQVQVHAGSVTLRGSVDMYWKKLLAEELCSNIKGVIEITDMISVTPTGSIIDENIAHDVIDALDRNVAVDAGSIELKVENGAVTLSGTVDNGSAKRAAFFAAVYTKGVTQVIDHVTVGRPFSDARVQ